VYGNWLTLCRTNPSTNQNTNPSTNQNTNQKTNISAHGDSIEEADVNPTNSITNQNTNQNVVPSFRGGPPSDVVSFVPFSPPTDVR
jgi:hypothetical protein